MPSVSRPAPPKLTTARAELARRLEHWFDIPMAVLGVVWLLLLVVELLRGPTPASETAMAAIWVTFVLEFGVRLAVAPRRGRFVRRNWITAVSLLLPAFRVLRAVRMLRLLRLGRTARAARLARLLTSFNRGMRALGATMRQRGFPYVLALTAIVVVLGGAGMYTFEREASDAAAFGTFASALWWTAMLVTTMGSEYWPRTPEGRVVCLLLSIYAFAVFGYLTATLASYFVGVDQSRDQLAREIEALRQVLAARTAADPTPRQGG